MSNESGCGIGFELTAGGHLMMHVGFHADMICRHLECESVLIIRYRDTDGIVDICFPYACILRHCKYYGVK